MRLPGGRQALETTGQIVHSACEIDGNLIEVASCERDET